MMNYIQKFLILLLLFSFELQAQKADHIYGDVLVRLTPSANVDDLIKDYSSFENQPTQFQKKRLISKRLNIWKLSFDDDTINEYRFRQELRSHDLVVIAQPNHTVSFRQTTPNDPLLGDQWQWIDVDDHDVDADLAWDITTGGTNTNGHDIVVAVFDDGGDLDHPDLVANNWVNPHEIPDNGVDDDNNGYVDDVYGWNFSGNNNNVDGGGHGVNVAGMIGAVGNDNNQGTGINWQVKIMNIATGGIDESQVVEFYSYCYDMRVRYNESNGADGAFVVATNSSWGIDGGDPASAPLWCEFYDTMGEAGIVSCGATANVNWDIDVEGDLPTACPSNYLLSVTATNDNDERTFSAYGATQVDLGAPGEDIYTTSSGGGYTYTSGTSFASPLTAGVVGLLYSAPCSNLTAMALNDPAATALMVREYILEGVDPVPSLEGVIVTGGRINAYNSLLLVLENCGPCPAPAAVEVTDLTDVQGMLNWIPSDSTLQINMRWKESGSMDWIDVPQATSPYTLTGLMACTDYEFQLDAICQDTTSGFTNSYTFRTDGCCENPNDILVSDIADNGAMVTWNSVLAAQSYNVRYKVTTEADWTETNITATTLTLTDLLECTPYEIQFQVICVDQTIDYTESTFFNTTGCGPCIDLTYCDITGNTVDEFIETLSFAGFTNDSGDDGSYGDYTGVPIELTTYQQYPISITPGYHGTVYQEVFTVYIDYNQDGEFNNGSELIFSTGQVDEETSGEFIVPGDALEGLTRIRFVMQYQDPAGPCAEMDYGEAEDYCVNITAGTMPECTEIPADLSSNNIMQDDASISWTGTTNALSYDVRHRPTATGSWVMDNSTENSIDLNGLVECTNYEVQVRAVCIGGTSEYSGSHMFDSECIANSTKDLESLSFNITPNPVKEMLFVEHQIQGELQFKIVDVNGRISMEGFIENTSTINIAELSEGIYFLKLNDAAVKSFVKM